MSKQKYFWHGEPVKTDFGAAYVFEYPERPLWWYNFECNWDVTLDKEKRDTVSVAMLPAIKVTPKNGDSFYIANHYGIGAHKLRNGGWPSHKHFSIGSDAKFEGVEELGSLRNVYSIREFDEVGFSQHEAKRERWQKENFPEEYARMQALKESFRIQRKEEK